MAYEFRRLAPGDEAIVQRLSLEDARFEQDGVKPPERTPHTRESARAFLAVETNYQLVALANDEPVGQLIAYELIRRHGDGKMMFVYEISVRADHRRQGVGRGLFDWLRALCRDRDIARAFLMTNRDNQIAMTFYASLGARRDHMDEVVLDFDWSQ
jgi:ribosomal protein S18 acetylase RimI-like enzyme